jgi:hypothetical protein
MVKRLLLATILATTLFLAGFSARFSSHSSQVLQPHHSVAECMGCPYGEL